MRNNNIEIKRKSLINLKSILLIALCVIFQTIFLSLFVSGDGITVVKSIQNKDDLKIGDNVTIVLEFNNPYEDPVQVKIKDPNVFADTGVDIQCLEHTIPSGMSGIAYDRIIPYKVGRYSIDGATINYKDPITSEDKSNKSNGISFEIKDNPDLDLNSVVRHGISSVYRCDGISMQSSSSSSQTINSLNQQTALNNEQNRQTEQQKSDQQAEQGLTEEEQKELQERMQESQMQQKQNQMQNNQMNQDASSLKQQASEELAKQNQERQQFADELGKNEEFVKEHQEMLDKGYELKNAEVEPKGNKSGEFDFEYENSDGDKANIKGSMQEGLITEMTRFDTEYEDRILQKLRNDEDFKDAQTVLTKQGFNETFPTFSHQDSNYSKISMKYNNSLGEEAELKAEYINGSIENVRVTGEKGEKDKGNLIYLFKIFIIILTILVLSILFYRYYHNNFRTKDEIFRKTAVTDGKIDYKKLAMKMLDEAKELHDKGLDKDAYEKISYSLRYYFSHKLGLQRDITTSQLIKELKSRDYSKDGIGNVKKTLDLCRMVEFAKFKAGKQSFENAISYARRVVI